MKTTDAKIVYSPRPPSSKDVIWGKTVNGKIEFQTFGNEGWKTVAKEDILKDIFQIKEEILEELEDYIEEVTSQADWNQNDSEAVDYILNKPAIKAGQGENSIVEGDINNNVTGIFSHAEGYHTEASGNYGSHAEGNETTASGFNSHAEGTLVTASGASSHAEGGATTASGNNSHAEGYHTTANHKSQHVFGEYNIADPSLNRPYDRGNYVEIVGNGATSSARSNARTLDWSGNEVLAGKITANGVINGSLFFGSPITTTTLSGNATWNIDDLKTMMKVVLSGSTNTITLPNGGENPFRFQIIVAQDSTGSRALTISGVSGVNVYNPSEFDFSSGSANQICVCTIIWDGNEYIYECTNYVGGN